MKSAVTLSRRQMLAASSALLASRAVQAEQKPTEPIAFFAVSDTHYLAEKTEPSRMNEASATICARLIDTLNQLPGSAIPESLGGGTVVKPLGVIHGGDLIDTGDKTGPIHEAMQRTEWAAYVADYGLTGKDGKLKYPVYEVHGNHDSPPGKGIVIDGIIERNKKRPKVDHLSSNGLHCAWNWGHVRFITLGITVGQVSEVTQRRRYNPMDSLAFLIADLKKHVGESRKPVVITHHIDLARYAVACDPEDPKNLSREWHPCDVAAYYEAIKPYNIAAILYGHTHGRVVFKWDGQSTKATEGFPVFNIDNSSHFGSSSQSFFYFEITAKEVIVRELITKDRWETHDWSPQQWRHAIA